MKKLIFSAMIAMAGASAQANEEIAQGFGNDIPLQHALRQITPERYSLAFGPGVDVDNPVSWEGGATWTQVMESVLESEGLVADFSTTGNIRITKNDAHRAALSSGLELAPYTGPSSNIRKDSYKDKILGDKPGLEIAGMPKGEQSGAYQFDEAEPGEGAETAPQSGLKVRPVARKEAIDPKEQGKDAIFAGVDPNELAAPESVWPVYAGTSLENILAEWAERAGWTLVWETEYAYPIEASAEFNGAFIEAAGALIDNLSHIEPPVRGKFFKGNKVLVVSSVHKGKI